ncbi:MAG: 5,10-methylenetetrahydromethanopterin reductase [Natronomonas sp.]
MIGIEITPEYPIERTAELGEQAANSGFDTIFCSSHYNNRDPFVALDRIAQRTDSVRLGPGVVNPYETHPVTLASRVATLSESAGDRTVYGIGPGDPSTLSNLGYEREKPLRRVLEAFKTAQDLFDGERITHDGTFAATDAGLNYDAVGDIPIYVGGQGPHMTRMSAKHADGFLYNGSHPRDFAWAAEQVEQGLADRPEERGDFDFAAYASISLAEDEAAAREAARPPVAFITAGSPPPVLDRHDLDHDRVEQISERLSAGDFGDAYEMVSEGMIDAFCIAGTPETAREQIEEVLEYADSFVAGSPLGPDIETAIDLAGPLLEDLGVPAE